MVKISPISIAFGQAVRQERVARGITQEELADRCHLDRSYISQIERGLKNPTLYVVWDISKELDIRMITLIERTLEHIPAGPPESSQNQKED